MNGTVWCLFVCCIIFFSVVCLFVCLFVYFFVPRDCTERDLDDDRELPEMFEKLT